MPTVVKIGSVLRYYATGQIDVCRINERLGKQGNYQFEKFERLEEVLKELLKELTEAKAAPSALQVHTDSSIRMLAYADFRGPDDKGRKGQKDNTSELRHLETMCKKEKEHASSLMSVGRYGKLLALRFTSSIGATVFEIDFWKDRLQRHQLAHLVRDHHQGQ